jgi:hypothetical protein
MARRLVSLRIEDILQGIERARQVVSGTSLDAFESDWEKRWLIERAIEPRRAGISAKTCGPIKARYLAVASVD